MKGKIFNAQEVQAIIAGNKTQFREVIKNNKIAHYKQNNGGGVMSFGSCPYQVGQKIFCKESFFINSFNERMFKATFDYCSKRFSRLKDLYHDKSAKWKPAQQMKQEHSRLTLLIKEIKVERLAEMKPIDCVHEGIWKEEDVKLGRSGEALDAFANYWNATHKKPEEKFEASPFVWVCTIEGVK